MQGSIITDFLALQAPLVKILTAVRGNVVFETIHDFLPDSNKFFMKNRSKCFIPFHPHKNRQYENQGNDVEEQPTARPHGKGEPETLVLSVDKEQH